MTDLCGPCGHLLSKNHAGQPCREVVTLFETNKVTEEAREVQRPCACPNGVRADVFLCMQVSKLIAEQKQTNMHLSNIAALLLVANDLEVGQNGELKRKLKLAI